MRLAAVVLVWVVAACVPARAAHLDYLHVEANVGTSSGGHAALRIDDQVYHYRNVAGGVLRLARQDFETFRYVYTVAENRTIHVGRISVSDETRDRVQDHFNRRHLIEEEHFSRLAALRDDVALLERILAVAERDATSGAPRSVVARREASRGPQLLGVGFFDWNEDAPSDPTLEKLRAAVEAEYGGEALAAHGRALDAEIAALRANPVEPPSPALGSATETGAEREGARAHAHPSGRSDPRAPSRVGRPDASLDPPRTLSRDRMPVQPLAFSERFTALATARLAVAALERAPRLAPGVLRSEDAPDWRLEAGERVALERYAAALARRIVALFGSRPAGYGEAVAIGMARLVAIRESLRTNRWVVVDAFREDSERLADATDPARAEFLDELHRDARRGAFLARRDWLRAEAVGEREYHAVEAAANRYLEVRAGLATGSEIRVQAGPLVPHGEFTPPAALLPRLRVRDARRALAAARAREAEAVRALDAVYGYDLFTRNCVSAIFDTLEGALPQAEVAQRLGGEVALRNTLNFIPRVSIGAVERNYRVVARGEIPSLRRSELASMYARENPAKVYLRESNTLTSTIYRDNPRDGFFVFFTDDTPWTRPLYGAVNFVAGLGQALVGLVRAPFVGPREFVAGAEGAFFSLPELFFVNFRKGSLDYAPTHEARTRLALGEGADAAR